MVAHRNPTLFNIAHPGSHTKLSMLCKSQVAAPAVVKVCMKDLAILVGVGSGTGC